MAGPVTDPALLALLNGTDAAPAATPVAAAPGAPPAFDPGGGGGGWGDEDPLAPTTPVTNDVAKSAVSGAASGLTQAGGLSGDLRDMAVGGGEWLAKKVGVSPEGIEAVRPYVDKATRLFGPLSGPTSKDIKKAATDATGVEFHKPETRAGQYVNTIGEFVANPISWVGPGSFMMKGLQSVSGALGSEFASGGAEDAPYSRIIGAVTGSMLPRAAMRGFTPLPLDPNRQRAVESLAQEGIVATAGQQSGSRALRHAEGELGEVIGAGGATTREQERVGRQFTNAIFNRVGEHWGQEPITAPVNRAHTRIGNTFDTLAAGTHSQYDPPFWTAIHNAQNNYVHLIDNPLTAPAVQNNLERAVNQAIRHPVLEGDQYKSVRSQLERARRSSKDPELQAFYADMRQAYDDLVERHIAPELAQGWRDVRNQYRNLLVIDRVAAAAGENAAKGQFSPQNLRGSVNAVHGKRNYARGQGDFADLARNAEEVLSPLPQSGTAPRNAIHGLTTAASGGLGFMSGDQMTAMAGMTAAAGVPAVAGRTLMHPAMQTYLRNQRMTNQLRAGPRQTPAMARAMLLARRASEEEE